MARAVHRRILLRLYEDVPSHQRILQWLDGYSGRGLQTILCEALAIGLPQCLGEQSCSRSLEKVSTPDSVAATDVVLPSVAPVSCDVSPVPVPSPPVPAFVESQQSARKALKELFEKEINA